MQAPSDPNRRFYGAITVSDRGQIVIPAQARRDFGIEVGEGFRQYRHHPYPRTPLLQDLLGEALATPVDQPPRAAS